MEFEVDFDDPLFQQCMKDMNEQDASFDSASDSEYSEKPENDNQE